MELCLVRHGQTDQNKLKKIQGQMDFPLNETGKEEAHRLGKWLKENETSFDVIMASPLSRAMETASIISNELGMDSDVIPNEAFIERCFGECEGLDVCESVFVNILNDTAQGLEKSFTIQKRVVDECYRLENIYKNKRVLIVSHSHAIKALTTALDSERFKFNDKLSNCALCYFNIENNKIDVIKFNVKTI